MKVLLLGNGFDIANDLPTRYSDFLHMCEIVNNPSVYYSETPSFIGLSTHDNALLGSFCKALAQDIYNEYSRISRDNIFIHHFLLRRDVLGDKWLDFEVEINLFIEKLIKEMHAAKDEKFKSTQIRALRDKSNKYYSSCNTYKDLFRKIRDEHKELTRILEIYMDGYVNSLAINTIPSFKPGFYDHVLSFNYTNTYEEKYEPNLGCCYIHGKANVDRTEPCKMVLGFDKRYDNSEISEIELLPYVKFFQRLDLKTSCDYKEWLNLMDKDDVNLVDVYGHSLALADADIISEFILKDDTYTRIFYYDDLDRYDKLRNLAVMLGHKAIVDMVSGKSRRIVFVPTSNYSTNINSNFRQRFDL